MPRVARIAQNVFTGGEFAPRMYGRTDFEQYENALRECLNWLIFPQGGIMTRPGTRFVAEVKDSTNPTALFSFEFSDLQTYMIEAGGGYFRFYKNHARLFVESTGTNVTNGTFPTDISGWTNASIGVGSSIAWNAGAQAMDITAGATPASNYGAARQALTVAGGDQAKRHVVLFRVFAATPGKKVNVRVGTSIGGTELLTRTVETGYHSISFIPGTGTVHLEFRKDDVAETVSIDDVIVLSNQALELGTPFASADIRKFQQAQSADVQWWANKLYKPRELKRYGDNDWSLEDYTPTSDPFTVTGDYPAGVTFFGQRIVFGGTVNKPNKIWLSKTDDYQDMSLGAGADDDAIQRTIASGKINAIRWLHGEKTLIIGTLGGEYVAQGDVSGLVAPTTLRSENQTKHGVSEVVPIQIGSTLLFIQRQGTKIRQFVYDYNRDRHVARDITVLSEHITKPSITCWTYQEEPWSTVWGVRSDGVAVTLTYLEEHKVAGFARQSTDGAFEWFASMPSPENAHVNEVWALVRRTINGQSKVYVEWFDAQEGFYGQLNTDSALFTVFGGPQSSVSGLGHLEGKTVAIVGDGAYLGDAVVTAGVVSLPAGSESTSVEVGLKIPTPKAKLLRPELKGQPTIQAATQSLGETYIRLDSTITVDVNGVPIPERSTEDFMDTAPPPVSDDLPVPGQLGWGPREGEIEITQPRPLPATVLAVITTVFVGDD